MFSSVNWSSFSLHTNYFIRVMSNSWWKKHFGHNMLQKPFFYFSPFDHRPNYLWELKEHPAYQFIYNNFEVKVIDWKLLSSYQVFSCPTFIFRLSLWTIYEAIIIIIIHKVDMISGKNDRLMFFALY